MTAHQVVFEGFVSKVELPGKMGRFMVLYNHAPLISSLVEGDVVYHGPDGRNLVRISGGFVEVYDNNVKVCVEL